MTVALGGQYPYDSKGALAGPARVLWADPTTVPTTPTDLWSIIPAVANASGEYPPLTGWNDFGLSAAAPEYVHSKTSAGLTYQQPHGALFTQIQEITRTFTAQIAQIDQDNLVIVENNTLGQTSIAAATSKSAQKKVKIGLYPSFKTVRIAMVTYRPSGTPTVTEPAPSPVGTRPAAVALILPLCNLSAEDSTFSFDAGNPVNAAIKFTVVADQTQGAGAEHGYWIFETPGVIT
jgi:hypothetical protein